MRIRGKGGGSSQWPKTESKTTIHELQWLNWLRWSQQACIENISDTIGCRQISDLTCTNLQKEVFRHVSRYTSVGPVFGERSMHSAEETPTPLPGWLSSCALSFDRCKIWTCPPATSASIVVVATFTFSSKFQFSCLPWLPLPRSLSPILDFILRPLWIWSEMLESELLRG